MAKRKSARLAADLERGAKRLAVWRRGRKSGARIPEKLWALAVRLARKHGVHATARALKLNYYSLKRRLDASAPPARQQQSTFVDLGPLTVPASTRPSILELEDAQGMKLRVEWTQAADETLILELARSFWADS